MNDTPKNAPKWTKGPWTYAPIPGYQYVIQIEGNIGGLKLIAAPVPPGFESEVRANLALAAAAPDLYAALEAAYKDECDEPTRRWHSQARTAMAKAQGEQNVR